MSVFEKLCDNVCVNLNDSGCDWFCECCDSHMNKQHGFTTSKSIWICSECGHMNDVSERNIVGDFEPKPSNFS